MSANCYVHTGDPQRTFLPGYDDREDEDTIEIQLSPTQHEVLARAAEEAEREAAAPPVKSAAPAAEFARPGAELGAPAAELVVSAGCLVSPVAQFAASTPDSVTLEAEGAPPPDTGAPQPQKQTLPAAQPLERTTPAPLPPQPLSSLRRASGMYLAATVGAILLALSVTIAYQLGARARPAPTSPSAPVSEPVKATTPATAPPPSPPVIEEPLSSPVRFANPFDPAEIFEFPPGTSDAEARDAVAALLLKRAQERLPLRPAAKRADPSFARRI